MTWPSPQTRRSWIQKCQGILFVTYFTLLALIYATWILLPWRLLCRSSKPRVYEMGNHVIESGFFLTLVRVVESMIELRLYRDRASEPVARRARRGLVLCNHRTEIDWLFLWSVAFRMDVHRVTSVRVVIKSSLRQIPGMGWILELLSFPCVERFGHWKSDEVCLSKTARVYREQKAGQNVWLCIFPEGTTLRERTLESSRAYARMKARSQYQFVLHPRLKGFACCLDEFEPDVVTDLTIAYPDLCRGNGLTLVGSYKSLSRSIDNVYVLTSTLDEIAPG